MMSLSDKTIALLVAGRNAAHGYHVETEIMGTKGMLRVAQAPEKNLVTIMNDQGIIRPCSQNFPERFREAFIREAQEFVSCIQENVNQRLMQKMDCNQLRSRWLVKNHSIRRV